MKQRSRSSRTSSDAKPGKASTRRTKSGSTSKGTTSEQESVHIDYDRLRTVTKVIQLDTLILVDSTILSLMDPRELSLYPEGSTEYALSVVDARWWKDDERLDVVLGYRVTALLRENSSERHLFSATARFMVGYRLPSDFVLPGEDAMADLVMANGQINSFPYLRQLIADQTSRAGWPALHMNVLRAPAKRPKSLVRNAPAWVGQSDH